MSGRVSVSGRGVGFDPSFYYPSVLATASLAGGLWLRGDSITSSGGLITTWVDKFNNYGAGTVTSGSPQFTASSSMYGGRAVSTWTASQYITMTNAYPFAAQLTQPDTMYFVLDTSIPSATVNFIFSLTGTRQFAGFSSSQWSINAGGSALVSNKRVTVGPHVLCCIFNGATSAIYIDSSSAPDVIGNPGASNLRSLTIGSQNGGNGLTGNIAEILMLPGAHTQYQIAQMFAYFSAYYQLLGVQ